MAQQNLSNGTTNAATPTPATKKAMRRVRTAIVRNQEDREGRPAVDEAKAVIEACSWARRVLVNELATADERDAFRSFLNELEDPHRDPNAKPEVRGKPKRPQKDVKARRPPLSVKQIERGIAKAGDAEATLEAARRYTVVVLNDIRLTMESVGIRLTAIERALVAKTCHGLDDAARVADLCEMVSSWMDKVIEANRRPWLGKKRDKHAKAA